MRTWVVCFAACMVTACKSGEICDNGIDDDKNGAADCLDFECTGQSFCLPDGGVFVPNSGPCLRCGYICEQQANCLAQNYTFDTPLPECRAGICKQFNEAIQIHFKIDTQATWTGVSTVPRAANTRFISKRAYDGSAVSCATVAAIAKGKTATDADQIERNPNMHLVGFDVLPINTTHTAAVFDNPFLNVGTGSEFLIWSELWSGPRSTTTRLPTGQRMSSVCIESGPDVDSLTAENTCPSAACRTILVKMPPPD